MSTKATEDFDGFITPEGEMIARDDARRLIPIMEGRSKDRQELLEVLTSLARHCFDKGYFDGAQTYFEKIFELSDSSDAKAFCILSIGQTKEGQRDYEAALGWYRKAFSLEPGCDQEVWYFLHNNLGYCLNHFDRHEEALKYCRAAISINPERHNAHKNLGIALEGIGRYTEAAKSYINASRLCPSDPRALQHIEALVGAHPEVCRDIPGLLEEIESCRQATRIVWN